MILFPYQQEAVNWLVNKRQALLALEMGLGKTAICVRTIDQLKLHNILIICPSIAKINWQREFDKFSDEGREFEIINNSFQLKEIKKNSDLHLIITSYDLATKNVDILKKTKWDVLICDECHFLKSPRAKRTKAILGSKGLIHQANRFWGLSGTPMPNNPSELWPLLYTLKLTDMKYSTFVDFFCEGYVSDYGFQITGANEDRLPILSKMLKEIMLHQKKEDVLPQLPKLMYEYLTIQPTAFDLRDTKDFYNFVKNPKELEELVEKQKFLLNEMLDMAGVNYNLKLMSGPVATMRRYTGIQKVGEVTKLIAQEIYADKYDKIVIFAIHRDVIDMTKAALREFKPVVLYGKTPDHKRQRRIDKFQKNPACRIFIGNISAAGTAITLTAASQVLFLEMDWTPGNNAQAIMRCHRIGQKENVKVRFVMLEDSLDQKIVRTIKRKTQDITNLFEGDPK